MYDMILCVGNPQNQKITPGINKFSKITGYKINAQKLSLCPRNEHTETQIKSTIPFIIYPKKLKYLGINLRKHGHDVCVGKSKELE